MSDYRLWTVARDRLIISELCIVKTRPRRPNLTINPTVRALYSAMTLIQTRLEMPLT